MNTTWILVADSARARLFEADEAGAFKELGCYTNADARNGTRGQTTDRPPTVNESVGSARHAIEPHTSARAKAAGSFARELREMLDHGCSNHRFTRLVLIAPPRFLGILHASFGKQLQDCIVAEFQRDLTKLTPAEIRSQFAVCTLQ